MKKKYINELKKLKIYNYEITDMPIFNYNFKENSVLKKSHKNYTKEDIQPFNVQSVHFRTNKEEILFFNKLKNKIVIYLNNGSIYFKIPKFKETEIPIEKANTFFSFENKDEKEFNINDYVLRFVEIIKR